MQLNSYWLSTAPPFTGGQQALTQEHYDVAVVGGGFTGLSAARTLARGGARVALLEAGQIIGEASGRNGGQCNTGVAQDYASLVEQLGREQAIAHYTTYAEAVSSVERVIGEEAIDCDYLRHGKLKLAAKPEHYDKLARTCDAIRRDVDSDVEMLSAAAVREEVDSKLYHGGLLQRNGGQMHMGRFGVGLADAAARHGAHIFERTPMTRVTLEKSAYRLGTPKGDIRAENVLLATGASQTGPLSWFRRRLVPVGSFIVVTEPLSAAQCAQLLPQRRSYVTSRIVGHYFRLTADNRLLFGGRARFAMSGSQSDAKSGEILRRGLEEAFPQLKGIRLDYCWGGLVDMSKDRFPHAGQHNGMYYAMGYSGHGVQMSVHMGHVLAEVMLGNRQHHPWQDTKWPAIPGHFGKPWFLPLVGSWYRLQDRLH
ncbi:NAD(P)/FAD-dependent oxidoreductase [Halomonas sp. HL-93]|uniref:NAD(P)/FAD-dependent oxidoreductase n=1 Tax=Halomonas sp. HL-93 TaxID=1666906 RepID=UPI0006DB4C6A|nr:FAD-binding oxidoreductase [Halomonas sp. HL-93]KPQ19423.1 MAG: Glycine/D-amino acid oxidases (deaminating) [Halomonas sp. HL-93]SBR45587.1 Glycine/D-amino acid oxidase (deaminating) [Halomonas sp. HL-93]